MRMLPYSFRLDDEMREKMLAYCVLNDITASVLIRTIIEKVISNDFDNHFVKN